MPVRQFNIDKLYQEESQLKKEDIDQMKKWVEEQPYLPICTKEQLMWFYHSCYFNLESAKIALDRYFTLKTENPNCFSITTSEKLASTALFESVTVLPKENHDGYTIMFYIVTDSNPEKFNLEDGFGYCDLLHTLYIYQEGPPKGLIIVVDVKKLCFGHLFKMPINVLKLIFAYLQEAWPTRIKQLHFINVNTIFEKLFVIMKPFIKKDLLELIHLHKSSESLWIYIQRDILYEEYGGLESLSLAQESCFKNLVDNIELIKFWASQKVDEDKRPKQAKTSFGFFGLKNYF